MKKYLFISFFMLFCSLCVSAQNKTSVKVTVQQAEALKIDASGEPVSVGDISLFEIKGGTAPYSDYQWEQSNAEAGKDHKVTVKDANNCTVSIYVNVQNFSNIENVEFVQYAYPNPTSDIVNIPISQDDKKVSIKIIDTNGLVLYKNTVEASGETYPLTLKSCTPGKYFIQVTGSKTKTYSIIKK